MPKLAKVLEGIAPDTRLHVPLSHLPYIDHACMELLEDWGRAAAKNGGELRMNRHAVKRRLEGRRQTTSGVGAAHAAG